MVQLKLTGRSSILTSNFYPPIKLPEHPKIGLIYFTTYNTIQNITQHCYRIKVAGKIIEIPFGSYEVVSINEHIRTILQETFGDEEKSKVKFELKANHNTFQCEILCSRTVDLSIENSIAPILGFKNDIYEANKTHKSPLPVSIIKVNTINIVCDQIRSSYQNNAESHCLYSCPMNTAPGYRIVNRPNFPIFLPLKEQDYLQTITLKIVDQDFTLIDFQDELIEICIVISSSAPYS